MKLVFDKNQSYQLEAIRSVIGLFEGQPLNNSAVEFSMAGSGMAFTQAGVCNSLALTEEELLTNLNGVQRENGLRAEEISISMEKLWYNEDATLKGLVEGRSVVTSFPNYSIEMETGTGKTYVYLRSIYELHKVYGFKKFVIVVPSVAIREGVIKSLQITFDHLQEIYGNQPTEYKVYDSTRLADLGHFAKSNAIQILVINIDSFAKDANIINQSREAGFKPIEYIQKSNPIVIIDEPQNMESDIRRRAIANLNPLFALRYSATHKNRYNLVYKLDPVSAYDLGLVKQIEVDSVVARNDGSGTFVSVDGFKRTKTSIAAKVSVLVSEKGEVRKKQVVAKAGDDLYALSKGRDIYRDGYVLNGIDAAHRLVEFSGGLVVYQGQAVGGLTDELLREMVDVTVGNHFKKELALRNRGIKVLSVFFVDRVANYRAYDQAGNPIKGKFARWFEESYVKWQNEPAYSGLMAYKAEEVHDGYFSQDKSGQLKDTSESRTTRADDETFNLIMRDKERLLDIKTPLRFLFSHSALREGWDNPNVFQICTLNETKSDIKKRQEIGRGLRLCVDQTGARNLDRAINRLTLIVNESYEAFSRALQKEMEEDCGVQFDGRIINARARADGPLQEQEIGDDLFLALWEKIDAQTLYKLDYSTAELMDNCVEAMKKMPPIERAVIYTETNEAKFVRDAKGRLIELGRDQKRGAREKSVKQANYDIPDFVAYIQSKTALSRDTVTKIVLESNRLGEIFHNPQLFMDSVVRIVRHEFDRIKIKGIQYEKRAGQVYEMTLSEPAEMVPYLHKLTEVKKHAKTPYSTVVTDDSLRYVKLPRTFAIKTPIGPYNPDWALIEKEGGEVNKVYFVTEPKNPKVAKDSTLQGAGQPR